MVRFSAILLVALTAITALYFSRVNNGQNSAPLFELTDPENTGITFTNTIEEQPGLNVLESEFFFNGGGVAIGDVNNDGLPDIYLTANTGSNVLYLNQGNLRFKDITEEAGVSDPEGWSSGVTMVDINGDGLLDIYVCKTGKGEPDERRNKLYINNGDLPAPVPWSPASEAGGDGQAVTFTEKAADYGLDDPGYSTHAVFFDYDRDGDLDMYLVNYSVKRYNRFNIISIRDEIDPWAGDKLFRNDNGTFRDVGSEAGIIRNPIGFGLSATASDLNGDGWPDIYVANDFMEKDYLYINQQDGTFREEIVSRTTHISYFSMGADIADFNNDLLPDIMTADMLPVDYARRRVFKTPDYTKYNQLAFHGYHRQNMRNMLQMNNSDGTFTEIGQMAGIDKTDWSWAVLMADFDNDGWNDIYVTNGFPRDYTNLDYLNQVLWKHFPDEQFHGDSGKLYDLVRLMPKVRLHNYAFKNTGNLSFIAAEQQWGLDHYATSNGAAYGDLDNDGDLDLVVNNINDYAFIYKNNARELNPNSYLKVRLKGTGMNTFGIGARVKVTGRDGRGFFRETFPVRGYQSSVEPVLLFGLGSGVSGEVFNIEVEWSDGSRQAITDIRANQTITIEQKKSLGTSGPAGSRADSSRHYGETDDTQEPWFALLNAQKTGLNFTHEQPPVTDLIQSPLLPHTLSNLGPALAFADVNSDGLQDLFMGGGKGQAGRLLLQQSNGTFSMAETPAFDLHKEYEDVDALFFDADGNDSPDLYVVSGGNFDRSNGPSYQDRLYLNNGFGRFIHVPDALPVMYSSGGTVTVADFDQDGDLDLFVGGRVLTGKYPLSPRSFLLENTGGRFKDITSSVSPELIHPGMVTDAVWTDINHDGWPDLMITGEWMPVRIFKNNGDKTFTEITEMSGLGNSHGWWNVIKAVDIDNDGHIDLVAGNRGLNADLQASPENPVILYAGDFDDNGFVDPVMTCIIDGVRYPVPHRDQLIQQIPRLKEKFPDYTSYARASIGDIPDSGQLRKAPTFYAKTFASSVFVNKGDGTFRSVPLPREAQIFPIFDMIIADLDGDQISDIMAAGNNFGTQPELGPMAGQGIVLLGNGKAEYTAQKTGETGFYATGDVRKLEVIPTQIGPVVLLARNNNMLVPYLYRVPERKTTTQ